MKLKLVLITLLVSMFSTSFAQQNPSWEKWDWLIGEWIGQGTGTPGKGGGFFTFSLDLDKKILVRKSHSEYPAADNKPKVTHNDLMIVYPDYTGNPSSAIYFDNEGHTINYSIVYSDKSIVLTSNKIPDVPVFRLTYTMLDYETVNTKFEISKDGEKFTTYIEGKSFKTK
jgi:hypothetical protein